MPPKDVTRRHSRDANKRCHHEGEQEDSVGPRLIAVQQHRGAFEQESRLTSKHQDGAHHPNDEEHGKQQPGLRPLDGVCRDEQHNRDDHGVCEDSYKYSQHRYARG